MRQRSRESHEKLKKLKVERDLIVAKLQRPELEAKEPAEKEAGGGSEDGSTSPRRHASGAPTSLERLQLDRQTLAGLGLSSETVATLYRTIYVFTVGFHEHASNVLDGSSGNHELISRMWRAYSLMAEELSGQSVETELEVAMVCTILTCPWCTIGAQRMLNILSQRSSLIYNLCVCDGVCALRSTNCCSRTTNCAKTRLTHVSNCSTEKERCNGLQKR
jgi:hypothetical protein